MATCPYCDSPLEDGATFCPRCNAKFATPLNAPRPLQQAMPPHYQQPQQQPQPQPRQYRPPQPQPTSQPGQYPAPRRSRKPLIIGIAAGVAVLLVAVAVGLFFRGSRGGSGEGDLGPESGTGTSTVVAASDTWTVLSYYCGSNLETDYGLASRNLDQLAAAGVSDNATFVVETGGADIWRSSSGDGDHLTRLQLTQDGFQVVERLPRVSMGAEQTLADFVSWGVATYPADHYVLLFWDHGGGSLVGVCSDELDQDALELPEIAGGIAAAGVTFDIVGFDTCLMATLETAQLLAPYARYMVASEEIEPGSGWDWEGWPQWFNSPGTSAADLGVAIVDTYMEQCQAYGTDDTATLSVVDLSQIDELAEAFAGASVAMAESTASAYGLQPLITEGAGVQSFGYANYVDGYTDMVDLGDLMACMDTALGEADDPVNAALKAAIVYERHGEYVPRATGLSVFYPLNIDYDTFVEYFDLSIQNKLNNIAYLQFLAARTGVYDQVDWAGAGVIDLDPVTAADAEGQIVAQAYINDDGRYEVDITEGVEWVQVATYSVGMLLDDGSIARLGTSNDLDLDIDMSDGPAVVRYYDRFDGSWLQIGGSFVQADIVDMVADGDKPSYNLYSSPVEWTYTNYNGDQVTMDVNLLTRYNYPTSSYTVMCVYDDMTGSDMAGKATGSLSEGDTLRFVAERTVNGERETGSMGTITWTDDTTAEFTPISGGVYLFYVTVRDLFGNEYVMDPAIIDYSDGQRYAVMVADANLTEPNGDSD